MVPRSMSLQRVTWKALVDQRGLTVEVKFIYLVLDLLLKLWVKLLIGFSGVLGVLEAWGVSSHLHLEVGVGGGVGIRSLSNLIQQPLWNHKWILLLLHPRCHNLLVQNTIMLLILPQLLLQLFILHNHPINDIILVLDDVFQRHDTIVIVAGKFLIWTLDAALGAFLESFWALEEVLLQFFLRLEEEIRIALVGAL